MDQGAFMASWNVFRKWLKDSVFAPLEDRKMPVMEHLQELQVRITRAVGVLAGVFIVTFFYADTLVRWLRVPLQNAFIPGRLEWVPTDLPVVPFVFLAPGEALWQNIKVAGLFALVLAAPYMLWEAWQFVVPGLHAHERRFVGPFVLLSTVAFYAGLAFAFFFVLPFALNFLISYGVNAGFIPQLSIAQYVGFTLWFLMVFGLIFEVPLAITLMAKLGWVDVPFLKRYRKWAFLGAFIVAAILTPTPDPFNQCLMALPMYVFYEVGIMSARFFRKRTPTEQTGTARAQPVRRASVMVAPVGGDDPYVSVPSAAGRRGS
jgi:sec-independent protein translocase protein TatC